MRSPEPSQTMQTSAIVSLSVPVQRILALPKADGSHYTSIGTVFPGNSLYPKQIERVENGGRKSDSERVYRLRREAQTTHKPSRRTVSERPRSRQDGTPGIRDPRHGSGPPGRSWE